MSLSYREYLANHPVDPETRAEIEAQGTYACRGPRLPPTRCVKAGLTQAELAERIGVGQRQVSKIEHGDLTTHALVP